MKIYRVSQTELLDDEYNKFIESLEQMQLTSITDDYELIKDLGKQIKHTSFEIKLSGKLFVPSFIKSDSDKNALVNKEVQDMWDEQRFWKPAYDQITKVINVHDFDKDRKSIRANVSSTPIENGLEQASITVGLSFYEYIPIREY